MSDEDGSRGGSVYDGQTHLGWIKATAEGYRALDASRRIVGIFPTVKEAMTAIGKAKDAHRRRP